MMQPPDSVDGWGFRVTILEKERIESPPLNHAKLLYLKSYELSNKNQARLRVCIEHAKLF
jgi:hypothetical protein